MSKSIDRWQVFGHAREEGASELLIDFVERFPEHTIAEELEAAALSNQKPTESVKSNPLARALWEDDMEQVTQYLSGNEMEWFQNSFCQPESESSPRDFTQYLPYADYSLNPDELEVDTENQWQHESYGDQYTLSRISNTDCWVGYHSSHLGRSVFEIGELNITPVELNRELIADEIRKNTTELANVEKPQHVRAISDHVGNIKAHADDLAEVAATEWASRARTLLRDAADDGNLSHDLEHGWVSVHDALTSEAAHAVFPIGEKYLFADIHYRLCEDIVVDALKTAVEAQSPQNRGAEIEYLGVLEFASEAWMARAIELRQNSTIRQWEVAQVQALREQEKQPSKIAEILEREVEDVEQDISRAEELLTKN